MKYEIKTKQQLIEEIKILKGQLAESAKLGIKERHQEAKTLRESEKKYRILTENIPMYITYKNRKYQYMYCNKKVANEWRINAEEVVGKTDFDLFSKSLALRYRKEDEKIIKTGKQLEFEESIIRGGKEKYIYLVKAPVKDDNNRIIGILGIFRDITKIKRFEYDLRLFEDLINQTNDAIFVLEPATGNFVYVNDKTCMSLKYTHGEMLDMNISDVETRIRDIKQWKKRIEIMKKKVRSVAIGKFKRSDGTIFPVEVNATYVKHGNKDYLIAIARNITECRELLIKVDKSVGAWRRG